MKASLQLPVLNIAQATYECIFGRGCDGICCRNGRPGIYPAEQARIDENLDKFLPHLRPAAREVVEAVGYLSRRLRGGVPMVRVVDGWCAFFNQGCVLHKVGLAEGDKHLYKPAACALFPLVRDDKDRWYVRQKGFKNEKWDLFCLDPTISSLPASSSLQEEIELAQRYTEQGREMP